jgi:Dullard-like phosphatase family protein
MGLLEGRTGPGRTGNSKLDFRPQATPPWPPARRAPKPLSACAGSNTPLAQRPLSAPAASGGSYSPGVGKGASTPLSGGTSSLGGSGYPSTAVNYTSLEGVRWAWDPKQFPQSEWLSSAIGGNGPSPKREGNPWTPQKPLVETPPKLLEAPKGLETDDTTPPKHLNANQAPRRSHHRLVPTPQNAHIQGPLRSKIALRKEPLTASKPSPSMCDANTPVPQVRRSHGRAEYLHEDGAIAVETPAKPKKEMLSEPSVTSSRFSRDSALLSFEELPNSLRNSLMFCRNVPQLPCTPPGSRPAMLPPQRSDRPPRPTLVLDLDETLAHCSRSSSSRSGPPPANPDLIVHLDDQQSIGAVAFRPFAHHFLEVASKHFELVVFTASKQSYADKVINALDPDGTMIEHRLYRQHCTEHHGAFFKELSLLGRPMHQCILVDNSPISVACNPDHSVLCRSWYSDQNDQELCELLSVFKGMQLHSGGDCGWYLATRYGLREFFQGLRESVGRQ